MFFFHIKCELCSLISNFLLRPLACTCTCNACSIVYIYNVHVGALFTLYWIARSRVSFVYAFSRITWRRCRRRSSVRREPSRSSTTSSTSWAVEACAACFSWYWPTCWLRAPSSPVTGGCRTGKSSTSPQPAGSGRLHRHRLVAVVLVSH